MCHKYCFSHSALPHGHTHTRRWGHTHLLSHTQAQAHTLTHSCVLWYPLMTSFWMLMLLPTIMAGVWWLVCCWMARSLTHSLFGWLAGLFGSHISHLATHKYCFNCCCCSFCCWPAQKVICLLQYCLDFSQNKSQK